MSFIKIKSLFSLSLLASICFSSSAFAEDTTINITSTPAISLTTSSNLVILDIEPLGNGVFKSTPFTVTAGTNNPNGYTLYFSVADNSTNLTGSNGSISALDNNGTTGYTPSTFTMNRWGYSIGTIASEDNDTTIYHPAPTISSPSIIDAYNAPINTRNTTINLATKVDLTTASGSYSKQLVVSMLPTIVAYELSYDANTTDTVANLPSSIIAEHQWSDAPSPFIINTTKIPTRAGYNFLGYSTTSGATTAEYAYDATTNTFTPSTLTPTTTSSTLYAVWSCADQMLGGICVTYMQDFATNADTIKNAMVLEQQYQFIDKRDNKAYWAAKLKDGNVWMTQNLDLVLNTNTMLTREDTDLNGDVYAYTPKHNTTSGSLGTAQTDEGSWEGGEVYWKDSEQWCSDADTSVANGLIGASSPFKNYFTTTMPTTEGKHYHVGNYYQWATATAGSGNEVTTGDIEASSSICPRGWRLPDSSNNTNDYSFGKMLSQYGLQSTNTQHDINKAPLYFVSGGGVDGGTLLYAAGYGVYLSSRSSSATAAYYLSFNAWDVSPSDRNRNRYNARFVRCVAR